MTDRCTWGDCTNPAIGTLCRTHYWRRQHGKPMDAPIAATGRGSRRTPKQVLLDAALALADADSADDSAFERCWHRLRMAAARYRAALSRAVARKR